MTLILIMATDKLLKKGVFISKLVPEAKICQIKKPTLLLLLQLIINSHQN